MKSDYHSANLAYIKKVLGASYIAYEQEKDVYYLSIKAQGIDTRLKLEGTPNDVTPQRYAELLTQITKKIEQV